MNEERLDCTGMRCPKPIVLISRKMREVPTGTALEVLADDPAFEADLDAWLSQGMAILELREQQGSVWRTKLRKAV